MPLDVGQSPELKAALLGVKQADLELRRDINKDVRGKLNPLWHEALNGFSSSRLEQRVIVRGARVKVSAKQITALAATSTRPLSGGLVPAYHWPGVEFGARVKPTTFDARSPRGTGYTVTKRTGSQFRPRSGRGYVAHPAAGSIIRASVRIWVRTIVDKFNDFADVKAGR